MLGAVRKTPQLDAPSDRTAEDVIADRSDGAVGGSLIDIAVGNERGAGSGEGVAQDRASIAREADAVGAVPLVMTVSF